MEKSLAILLRRIFTQKIIITQGLGTYHVAMIDSFRCGDNFSNNASTLFCIETKISILNPFFNGHNNSPSLMNIPIDTGCLNQTFTFDLGVSDVEGDSVVLELKNLGCVQNYIFPHNIGGGANLLWVDTSSIHWNSPIQEGDYSVSLLIKEYRYGTLISRIIYDFNIIVKDCLVKTKEVNGTFDDAIKVYPNPAEEFIYLDKKLKEKEEFDLYIVNSLGQVYFEEKKINSLNMKRIDVGNYPKGIYFIQIILENGKSIITKKIIKN